MMPLLKLIKRSWLSLRRLQ
jgi:hypothetical protein